MAAAFPEVYFGFGNPIDALEKTNMIVLSARLNYRNAAFIKGQVINSPEQRSLPYGMGPPPAMKSGNYNCDTPEDEIELAKWYRAERFPRVSVTKGMITGANYYQYQAGRSTVCSGKSQTCRQKTSMLKPGF